MRGTAQPREQTTRPGLLRLTRLDRWVAESLPWPITIVLSQVLVPALKRRRTNWEPSFLEGTVLDLRTSGGTRYQFRPPHIPAWAVTAVTPSGGSKRVLDYQNRLQPLAYCVLTPLNSRGFLLPHCTFGHGFGTTL